VDHWPFVLMIILQENISFSDWKWLFVFLVSASEIGCLAFFLQRQEHHDRHACSYFPFVIHESPAIRPEIGFRVFASASYCNSSSLNQEKGII
jgi:hypothetical protein